MSKTIIIFGSTTGNTETAAEMIQEKLGGDVEMKNVDSADADDLGSYDNLILGTSTWGAGDLQDDWEGFIDELQDADLSGKTVALFGLGDSDSYPDTFTNGMSEIYNTIKDKGCNIVGATDTEGYDFTESESVVDGKFVGLALDYDNQEELSEERIEKWVESIKSHL
jgi:flavodoxin I